MFLHAGRHLNRGLKLLINHGEKTPESLERLVAEMHDDKELCCYQLLNHPGSEDILWGIIRLLASKDSSVAGHAAYVIGSLCDMEVGRRRILEIIVTYKDEGFDVLSNLTKILYCRDNESVMNASGTIGTLAETIEGRSWMLRKGTLDETLTRISVLLANDDIWTASNAALIIARLTIEEEGCARILNRRDTRKLLVQLVNCLGTDEAVIIRTFKTIQFGLLNPSVKRTGRQVSYLAGDKFFDNASVYLKHLEEWASYEFVGH
eukprot:gene10682-19446_t